MHLLYRGVFVSETKLVYPVLDFLSLLLFLSGHILFLPVFWKILEAVILVCKMQFGVGLCLVYVTF